MEILSATGYATLRANREKATGDKGVDWVESIPSLAAEIAERWSLSLEPHFNLSYNYVAPVRTRGGELAVLKFCFPDDDFLCEAEALRAFDGHACVRLLDLDREAGAMLIERLIPGAEVHTLADDVRETSAVAAVMHDLQRPYAGLFPFPQALDWLKAALDPAAISDVKDRHPWIGRALARLAELAQQPLDPLLLHGDLHHDNVLSGRDGEWLAIDPKGVLGHPAWEIAPFLFNRLHRYPRYEWPRIIRRRADQFAEELSLNRERVYAWSAVRAIQAAAWSLEGRPSGSGSVYQSAIVCAQALAEGQGD